MTVTLEPTDCFVQARAREASISHDQATNPTLAEALGAAFTAAGMAAADFHMGKQELEHRNLETVRQGWIPHDDRQRAQPRRRPTRRVQTDGYRGRASLLPARPLSRAVAVLGCW